MLVKMKKIIYKITGAVLLLGVLLTSCTKDFEEINTDPNNPPIALPQQLLAPALVNTMSFNMLRNRNFNNELMQVTVDISDAEGRFFRYDIRANQADNLYNGWYSELTNFKDIYKVASDELTYNPSYMGISLICQSWIYSMLTDTYGDVPYFESNQSRDEQNFEPAFDRQKDIYLDIFKQLEEANRLLSANVAITGNSDPVYGGNIGKWRKFGNSLYLRLLMRISGKPEMTDTCVAKFKQIVASYPIIASNDESAILRWTGIGPYVSPLMAVREQDFRSPAIASFFISHLSDWNDPRIDIPTWGSQNINRWCIAPSSGAYVGVPSGYAPGQNPVKRSYFYSTSSDRTLMNDPLTGMILNYAEVNFMLAEAVVKGWINGSAETYYNTGAQNSITQWLPNWNVPIRDFLAEADIQWIESATLEEKMERIHLQKYYALFLTDLQQWFEYRRTGHPVLPKGPGLKNNGVMPARLNYPVYVQSTNPTNYRAAVAAQGPDVISTEVWWQKKQ
jgi:hypothetical protein